jgi:CrcB protein
MRTIILIGIGGLTGAILRYTISGLAQNSHPRFPLGTLAVNIIGSILLGLIMYLSEYSAYISTDQRIFLTVGMLGAFTTMSTFSYETFKLFEQKAFYMFLMNLIGNNLLCFTGIYLGKLIALRISGVST